MGIERHWLRIQSQMNFATTRKYSLKTSTISSVKGETGQWGIHLTEARFLPCHFGMMWKSTCCGWILHTPWINPELNQASYGEIALEGRAARPLTLEISTLTVMLSLPMRPSEKLAPRSLAQMVHFPRNRHRLALMVVRHNQAKIHLNAMVRRRPDASRWLSTKTSANGSSAPVQARQQRFQQPLRSQQPLRHQRHQPRPHQCAKWIEL